MIKFRYAPSYARITAKDEPAGASTETIADLIHRLGDIDPQRILLHPAPGTATEEDLIQLLEGMDKRIFELIDGVLVEKVVSTPEGMLAAFIGRQIGIFADRKKLGLIGDGATSFRFRLKLIRVPDVSFVSWNRIPEDSFPEDAVTSVVPDLAVEVLSPSNTVAEIELKLDHYFECGVRLAWIIDPKKKTAKVYTSRSRVKVIDATGELSGGKVLPGFQSPMRDIFNYLLRPKPKRR